MPEKGIVMSVTAGRNNDEISAKGNREREPARHVKVLPMPMRMPESDLEISR